MRGAWWAIHLTIIFLLVSEAMYCGYQVMVVLQPEGMVGPLGARAMDIPFELLVSRRLYAIEGWVATGAASIYLAITEIKPRLYPDG